MAFLCRTWRLALALALGAGVGVGTSGSDAQVGLSALVSVDAVMLRRGVKSGIYVDRSLWQTMLFVLNAERAPAEAERAPAEAEPEAYVVRNPEPEAVRAPAEAEQARPTPAKRAVSSFDTPLTQRAQLEQRERQELLGTTSSSMLDGVRSSPAPAPAAQTNNSLGQTPAFLSSPRAQEAMRRRNEAADKLAAARHELFGDRRLDDSVGKSGNNANAFHVLPN